ncbi:hypothetical protein [Demequina gelatinilytica]|uniref:hypothetical protein n=1 Tax=Demequina gelatinilytica TaxID=1638980 RepID=UPI000783EC80|nr:hypothetical protein [Demequina gelatinilytica]
MPTIVPPHLFNLAGLPDDGRGPHLRAGNHLRVSHHPRFGLPVAPFIMQRAQLDGARDALNLRRGVTFRDGAQAQLTLPIQVRKGDRILATIPQDAATQCVAVAMVTRPTPDSVEPVRPRPDLRRPIILNRPDLTASRAFRPAVAPPEPIRSASGLAALASEQAGALRMRAYGAAMGEAPALLGERREAPYMIGAPSIAEVEVTGDGVIVDLVWLAASDLGKLEWESISVLNLPHTEGRRYLSVSDPFGRAEGHLREQAPQRRPMQETVGATSPAVAAGFSDAEESDRVHALGEPLDRDLDALIDGTDLPLVASEAIPVTDAAGNALAEPGDLSEIQVNHLFRVLQGSLDPGVAAWLGYKDLDLDPPAGLALYRAIGFFRHPLAIGATPESLAGLPVDGAIPLGDRSLNAITVARMWNGFGAGVLGQEGQELTGDLEDADDYLVMAAIAAVVGDAIPSPPPPPVMLEPAHVAWLPVPPPDVVREVVAPLKGLLPGATLAAEREQPVPGGHRQLNRELPSGWHVPLTVGLTSLDDGGLLADQDGRQGVVGDRRAGPDAARYHGAQQDRFGRWSEFSARDAAPGPRPKPPRPVVLGSYQGPSATAAASTGGILSLRVPLPEPGSLAPGSHPLSHAVLTFRHHGVDEPVPVPVALPDVTAAVGTAIVVDEPPPGEAPLRAVPAVVSGPVLQPTEQRRMIVTAVWVDAAGQVSAVSEELRLLMSDPRPPAQLDIPDVLLYSARPDATGLAWVERSWSAPSGGAASFAIYYTDEVRLVSWLRLQGRFGEAATISGTLDRAARAGLMRDIQGDFPDHLFERLPGAVSSPSPGTHRFRHAVSGSSRVLNAYKIAVEAPGTGARPALGALPIVFYGVPNSDPPPRPAVTATLSPPVAGEPPLMVEVTVEVEPGITPALTARIFRTRGTQADPMHAPVVAEVPLSAPDPQTGRQRAVVRDRGSAQIAPGALLTAFARYQWLAQVQGAPESGSSVPGMWSRESDPVGVATVPLEPPAAPLLDALGGTAAPGGTSDLTLTVSHPSGLAPTLLGPWRFEAWHARPGEEWSILAAGDVASAPLVLAEPPGEVIPLGTSYRVRVYDPVGRPSPALDLVSS